MTSEKKTIIDFNAPITAAVCSAVPGERPGEDFQKSLQEFLSPEDTIVPLTHDELEKADNVDISFFYGVCGASPGSKAAAAVGVPVIGLQAYPGFHPYIAAFYTDIEERGGFAQRIRIPEDITETVEAVRAVKTMKSMKLIVADTEDHPYYAGLNEKIIKGITEKTGVEVIVSNCDILKEKAAGFSDGDADEELKRLYEEVWEYPSEMDDDHMRQTVRLFLAQKQMLEETGAHGISTNDIGEFLKKGKIMPNVTYSALVHDGYLAAEEADLGVLMSELLLYAGTGSHPTMSNIYFAYRDALTKAGNWKEYTHEMELEDCRLCFKDNRLTVSHFSSSGVLPLNMMEEEKYKIRETVPDWPGQSMAVSTPKLGPVIMARVTEDGTGIHYTKGDADGLGIGDQYGWSRGRWFIKLPDINDFVAKCLNHHYAIGTDTGKYLRMKTVFRLCGLNTI